ncbi:MAG: hypothetical protein FJY81_06195 [Candidatus Aminicenantes bacterium]|nr:hypothetical protein [Candidatus Aminicenantes bacterium]
MRKELFWDRAEQNVTPEIEIERAINFGGLDYIEEVQRKYGMDRFRDVILKNRSLSKKAVNYWCLVLGIDRKETAAFKNPSLIWSPYR